MEEKNPKLEDLLEDYDFKKKEVNPWEKRLTLIIITLILSYIAAKAGNMDARLDVIKTRLSAMVEIVNKHDKLLLEYANDLRKQDTRLTRVETEIKLTKKNP